MSNCEIKLYFLKDSSIEPQSRLYQLLKRKSQASSNKQKHQQLQMIEEKPSKFFYQTPVPHQQKHKQNPAAKI
jgi:hypothetical protein